MCIINEKFEVRIMPRRGAITYFQRGGSKSHQSLRRNKLFLGGQVKRHVEASRTTKYDHVNEWLCEALNDAWDNGKFLLFYVFTIA